MLGKDCELCMYKARQEAKQMYKLTFTDGYSSMEPSFSLNLSTLEDKLLSMGFCLSAPMTEDSAAIWHKHPNPTSFFFSKLHCRAQIDAIRLV